MTRRKDRPHLRGPGQWLGKVEKREAGWWDRPPARYEHKKCEACNEERKLRLSPRILCVKCSQPAWEMEG